MKARICWVIHPDECIDCGIRELECPANAISRDTEPGMEEWLKLNAEFTPKWPNVWFKREPAPDAADWDGKRENWSCFLPCPGPRRLTRRTGVGRSGARRALQEPQLPRLPTPRDERSNSEIRCAPWKRLGPTPTGNRRQRQKADHALRRDRPRSPDTHLKIRRDDTFVRIGALVALCRNRRLFDETDGYGR